MSTDVDIARTASIAAVTEATTVAQTTINTVTPVEIGPLQSRQAKHQRWRYFCHI